MTAVNWSTIKHFQAAEFACRCCGREQMHDEFVRKLDDLRERVGFPLIVTSGYRCPEYNRLVSKTGLTGPHTTGRAVDLQLAGRSAFIVVGQVVLGGWMTGIGLLQQGQHSDRFLHLDDLNDAPGQPRPWIWTY